MAKLVYTFISPYSYEGTIRMLDDVYSITKHKPMKRKNDGSFVMVVNYQKISFFIQKADRNCIVRATIKRNDSKDSAFFPKIDKRTINEKNADKIWYKYILTPMFRLCPNVDFGLTLDKKPTIADVMFLDRQMQRTFTAVSLNTTGLLGGLTVGSSQASFPDRMPSQVRFSNGRIKEGYIKKDSNLYQYIVVNLKELTSGSDYNC